MIFTEPRFLVFFLIVFGVYWLMRWNSPRKTWLLLCSYVFYAAWDWRFLGLILFSTIVDYTAGYGLSKTENQIKRRLWLTMSIVGNVGLLGAFKYFNFFIGSGADFLDFLGIPVQQSSLNIILPVGISFYTFQTMSYTLDVFKRKMEPTHNLLDIAFFVAFFPQLVAGPIVRAATFLPQTHVIRRWNTVNVRACLVLFMIGFIKKACVSDSIAPVADQYFADPAAFDVLSAWVATLLFGIQVYCDFSGYSDMAIAAAGLLGYELCINFNYPLFSTNIARFWERWHISLSGWLRDYVYFALGGSRGSTLFKYRNILLTMGLCGLWHGAAWRFVAFGLMHGIGILIYETWSRFVRLPKWTQTFMPVVFCMITFHYFCASGIIFRAHDPSSEFLYVSSLSNAITGLKAYLLFSSPGTETLPHATVWLVIFAFLAVVHWISYKRVFSKLWRVVPSWVFAIGYAVAAAIIFAFMPTQAAPFFYFQF